MPSMGTVNNFAWLFLGVPLMVAFFHVLTPFSILAGRRGADFAATAGKCKAQKHKGNHYPSDHIDSSLLDMLPSVSNSYFATESHFLQGFSFPAIRR